MHRKMSDDLNETSFTPHMLQRRRYKNLATVNFNKTPDISESNANSSCISQDPSRVNYAQPDTSILSSIISSADVIAAKGFLGSKFVYEEQYSEFSKMLFRFIGKIKKRRVLSENLLGETNILNPRKITQYFAKDNRRIEAVGESLCASFQEVIHWNIASKNLRNEIILNHYTIPKSYPRIMDNSSQQNNNQNLKNITSSNRFSEIEPFASFEDSDRKNVLNLLCIFTENNFYDNNSNLKQSWFNEDFKLVLPMAWNVVVAYNAITITNENSQNIRLFFKTPLKTKVYYDESSSPSTNTFSELFGPHEAISKSNTMESGNLSKDNCTNENFQKKNGNFSPRKSFVVPKNNKTRTEIFGQGKLFYGRTHATKHTVKHKINPLLLADPLLLTFCNEIEQKQILLYKDHSVRSSGLKGSDRNFCKAIEDLLAKSVSYEGTDINLILDPLQVILQIRGKQRNGQELFHAQPSEAKRDLTSHYKSSGDHPVDQDQWSVLREKNIFSTADEALLNDASFVKLVKKISSTSVIPVNAQSYQDSNVFDEERLPSSFADSGKGLFINIRDAKQNLHIRLKRKSRTAYKRVNAKKIAESVFRHFFHFYSLVGGQLKSGYVITKSNSNYWLKISGLIHDSNSLQLADELFTVTAGAKVVLNIYDYLKFLTAFARNRRLIVADLIKRMMVCELTSIMFPVKKEQSSSTLRSFPIQVGTSCNGRMRLESKRSQSLPTIQII